MTEAIKQHQMLARGMGVMSGGFGVEPISDHMGKVHGDRMNTKVLANGERAKKLVRYAPRKMLAEGAPDHGKHGI